MQTVLSVGGAAEANGVPPTLYAVPEPATSEVALPDFDLHMVERALQEGHLHGCRQLTVEETQDGIQRYREFMRWMKVNGMPSDFPFPGPLVDRVWHTHICETAGYREDCDRYFGRFLEHSYGICDGGGAGQP